MSRKLKLLLVMCLICLCSTKAATGQILNNKKFKFAVTLPPSMAEIRDSTQVEGELYFDTTAGVVLMISANQSKFKSVHDYLDCSREKLQEDLRNNYEDSTLSLIYCGPSDFYPQTMTMLQFRVSVLPAGYDSHCIYFIHHRKKEIQISYSFCKQNEEKSMKYINAIMKTLVLR